jgi:putative toxin-antitoxin system antitoxin component (TIGR02293 family)
MRCKKIKQNAEVATWGATVFGDKDKFLSWMKQPNKALDGKIPINLLSSRFGSEMILEQLGRIEHGVFS